MSVGSRMKERRESLGLTQVQLADMLGVTKGAIGNYETDANSPKASILYKVFEVLKCDANYIFQDEIQERREYTASPHEMEHLVKKYRTLDEYGKEAVDGVLETEHRRCKEQRERSAPLPYENVLPHRRPARVPAVTWGPRSGTSYMSRKTISPAAPPSVFRYLATVWSQDIMTVTSWSLTITQKWSWVR